MPYGRLPNIDRPLSRIVQGTTMLGTALDEPASFALLDRVLAAGCTAFDTAHVYGSGQCETMLGRWLQARGVRGEVVIIGKGAHHSPERQRVTPADITADLQESLDRLQTDYVDLYLLHRDDPSVPVGPIVEVLNDHQRAGRMRAFGGSNWSTARLADANAYARARGLAGFAASSPQFSLAEQLSEPWPNTVSISGPTHAADRAWYVREAMPVFTWSSLASGFFSGRFRRDNLDSFTSYADRICVEAYAGDANFERLARATQVAEERGLSVAQVALAYVLHQPLDLYAIVGPFSAEEYEADVAAAALELTPAELAWLDLSAETR